MSAQGAGRADTYAADDARPVPGDEKMWTARLRGWAVRAFPPGKLLPDRQPSYVASWVYVFGVLTLAAFFVILGSGVVLVWRGPAWWHVSTVGLFFNSIHLWSVELFFFFMVLHLWGKFFMAAWRGNRTLTWMTGVVSFLASIATAFTGYLSQQNFDSQWISTQAKDGLNSVGVGAFFNVMNFGQMLLWHVLLLPVAVAVIVALHLLMVRHRGVVRPMARKGDPKDSAKEAPTTSDTASTPVPPEPVAAGSEPALAGAGVGAPAPPGPGAAPEGGLEGSASAPSPGADR